MSNTTKPTNGMTRMVRTRMFAFAAAIASLTGTAAAQDFSFGWNPRSGDVWVDSQLDDVNRYGSRYRQPFIDEMVRYYGAPRDLVSTLLVERNWAPGDVYYACAIAQILGRPCRYVADVWERDHGQGWGNVAKQLGIKPGSAEFHRLKRGFVPTYDRWARPIRIDEDLYRHYPDRAKAIQARGDDGRRANGKANGKASASGDRGNGNGHGNARGNNGKGDNAKGGGHGKAKGHDNGKAKGKDKKD